MLGIFVSFISGIVLSFAFPRGNLCFLAWFALSPVMYYIYHLRWRNALAAAFAFGLGFYGVLIYWIALFGKLPWVLLVIYESLFVVAFAASARLIGSRMGLQSRLILLPSLWVIFEWARSKGMLGFTWGDLGYSQYKFLPVVQIVSLTGIWGLSFLLAASNAVLANLLTAYRDLRKPSLVFPQLAAVLAATAAVIGFGVWTLHRPSVEDGRVIRAAIVQGNIKQDLGRHASFSEQTWGAYDPMTRTAGEQGADLIIWPETTVPGAINLDSYLQERLQGLAKDTNAQLVVGGWKESGKRAFNSAFLIDPGRGLVCDYSKVHLVPFGEFVPARKYLPFLEQYCVRAGDTSPGSGFQVMDTGSYKLGMAICFESAFSEIPRALTKSGAEVLCVITEDEWFGNSPAAEQHMSKSVLRAVENRRYLLRAAATGISCIIDPSGRILDRAELWNRATLQGNIHTRNDRTPFVRYGDWVICLSAGLVLLSLGLLLRRK